MSLEIYKDSYDVIWVIQIIKIWKKIYISYIFLYFFLLKYIICDQLHQYMKKNQMFCIKLWYNN